MFLCDTIAFCRFDYILLRIVSHLVKGEKWSLNILEIDFVQIKVVSGPAKENGYRPRAHLLRAREKK